MCEIRRINHLKRQARKLSDDFRNVDPLSLLSRKHVSGTGLTYSDLDDKIKKVESCSSVIELKESFNEGPDGLEQVLKVSAANFCKQHTVCPVCADRSQSRRRARYNDSIINQAKKVEAAERFAYMITYTIPDGPDLAERLEHLKNTKREFRRMGQKRKRGRSAGEAGKIKAALSTVEIKRGENSGEWHAHIHELAFTDEPIDYTVYDREKRRKLKERYGDRIPKEKLDSIALNRIDFNGESVAASKVSAEWFAASGGDSMSISVEPIRHVPKNCSGKKKRKYRAMSFVESVAYQSRECLKYPFKPTDNSPLDRIEIISDTFNKRMVASYGEFRGIGGDDYADPAGDDEQTFVLIWDDVTGKYGEPVPAKLRDIIEDEETHKTRSEAGRVLGEYRRRRRELIAAREQYGDSLHVYLDNAKSLFKKRIGAIWSLYRQRVSCNDRMTYAHCDKYSPVMAVNGIFIPGSDSRDIYAAAFT